LVDTASVGIDNCALNSTRTSIRNVRDPVTVAIRLHVLNNQAHGSVCLAERRERIVNPGRHRVDGVVDGKDRFDEGGIDGRQRAFPGRAEQSRSEDKEVVTGLKGDWERNKHSALDSVGTVTRVVASTSPGAKGKPAGNASGPASCTMAAKISPPAPFCPLAKCPPTRVMVIASAM